MLTFNTLLKTGVTVAVCLCLLSPVASTLAGQNGAIVERVTYSFPTFEQAVKATNVERYYDEVSYDKAVADDSFVFQKVKYISDGLKVIAYIYRPRNTGGQKLPAIVFNRGSAVRGDIAPELIPFFHRLASSGFVIVAPMLRQSDGGEGRDEMGGADVNDLMNVIPMVKSLGFVDLNNLFMYGESRGGMMTYQAIKREFPMNAAAVFGAFTDLKDLISSHPTEYPTPMLEKIWPDYQAQKEELFRSRSAALWTDRLNIPLLIMHGGADRGLGPEQSLTLAQQLQKLGKVYELIIYANDNHFLSRNAEDRDRRAVDWFKRHIRK